jgi:hypothetical protein
MRGTTGYTLERSRVRQGNAIEHTGWRFCFDQLEAWRPCHSLGWYSILLLDASFNCREPLGHAQK